MLVILSKDLSSYFMIVQIDCRVFTGDWQMFLDVSNISFSICGAEILFLPRKLTLNATLKSKWSDVFKILTLGLQHSSTFSLKRKAF